MKTEMQKLIEGCGSKLQFFHGLDKKIYWKCGETETYKWMYCPTCKAKIQERIKCNQEELKLLEWMDWADKNRNHTNHPLVKRISHLKSEIKLGEDALK